MTKVLYYVFWGLVTFNLMPFRSFWNIQFLFCYILLRLASMVMIFHLVCWDWILYYFMFSSLVLRFPASCFLHSLSKSMRLKISFSLQEGKTHARWKSRGARMRWSSRSVAPSTSTRFVFLTQRRLTNWSSLFLQVNCYKNTIICIEASNDAIACP